MRHALGVTLFVLFSSALHANTYTLTTEGEQVIFEAAPELGYVTKQADKKASFMSVVGSPVKDVGYARRLPTRSDIWMVENDAPTKVNRETIGRLRLDSRITYAAPMFSVNSEAVGVIPEIVVKVADGIGQEDVQTLCESLGLAIIKPMEFTTQEYLLEVFGQDAEAVFVAVHELEKNPVVEWAWPNILLKPELYSQPTGGDVPVGVDEQADAIELDVNVPGVFPNDEYFTEQWHLHNTGQICLYGSGGTPNADINAPEAWEITKGDPNIIIGVPDTGVDINHPDLMANLVPGYDFLDDDANPEPDDSKPLNHHGTVCAGLVAAQGNNTIGVTGVTWNCKIMPIRIESDGELCSDADIATAFRWMANHGADVISNSWGFGYSVPITHSAIIDITEPNGLGRDGKGCVVLDASGNSGKSSVGRYIARYPEVIAVGATDHDDKRWYYSAYGAELDVVAPSGGRELADIPGGFLCSTEISGQGGQNTKWMPEVYGPVVNLDMDYAYMGGTSSACPVAAGVAALILSIEPDLASEEVRHFLQRSAKDLGAPGRDNQYGWGRVDARAALDMVLAKRADLNNNWEVDLEDLVILIESWETEDSLADIAPATKRDGLVDEQDLELLLQYWQVEIPAMEVVED